MEVELIEDKENPLLNRREVKFKVSFQGPTPNRMDVRSKLVAVLNSDKELTILDKLESEYGSPAAVGYIKVYNDVESMRIEPDYIIARNFKAKEKQDKDDGAESPQKEGEAIKAKEGDDEAASEKTKPAGDEETPVKVEAKTEGGVNNG